MPYEFLMLFPYYTIYCGYPKLTWFEYMTLDPIHMLLLILSTWFLFALVGLLSNNSELACSELKAWTKVDPSAEDHAFLEEQADQPVSFSLALLAIFSLSAREFLSFGPYITYFCAPWWCNNYVILCHSLWWLSTCTFMLECILSCTSILWLLCYTDA